MTNDLPSNIQNLIDKGMNDEAIEKMNELLMSEPDNAAFNFMMGKLLWKVGKRSEAMSFYLKADKLNPDGPARRAIEMSRDIESYFNPDLLNP